MTSDRIRLRFVAPLRPKTPPHPLRGEIAFLPMEAIGDDGTYDRDSIRPAADIVDLGYTYFEQDDVVRARVTPCFENGKGALLSALRGGRGLGTTELFVFRSSPDIEARFLYYVTASEEFTTLGTATLYGAHGVRRVDDRFARDYRAWVPTIAKQRAVADYLDRETARIDALIAAKRRMVELLEEREREFIGLTIERVAGERRPLRWFAVIGSGNGLPPSEVDDEGQTPVYGGNGIMGYTSRAPMTREPSIAIGRVGALCGNVHIVPGPAWITDNALWLRDVRNLDINYLALVLRAARLNDLADKTAQPLITGETVKNVRFPFPAITVQREIQQHLAKSVLHTSTMTHRLGDQVGLLQERRQALITAAVTGQLDIPEAA